MVVSQKYSERANQTEEWYGVRYSVEEDTDYQRRIWRESSTTERLTLPARNEFIPHDFDLVERDEADTEFPRLIRDTLMSRCWFKQDNEFKLPKGCLSVAIRSPVASSSPLNVNLTWIFVRLFDDAFTEFSYDAALTQLQYGLDTTRYGLLLTVSGYTDKLGVLLEKIMDMLTTFKIDEKKLQIYKDQYEKIQKNFSAKEPYAQTFEHMSTLLDENHWTIEEMLESLDDINVANLNLFIPQLFSRVHLESLLFGNFTEKSAVALMDVIETHLVMSMNSKPLPHSLQTRIPRHVQLPDDSSYVFHSQNDVQPASCVLSYYQFGLEDVQSTMLLELLVKIIKDPVFNILRTQEQLGYMIFTYERRGGGVQGLGLLIQSDKHPDYVDSRMEAFLAGVKELLDGLSDSDYTKHVDGLVTSRLTKPKKITDRHNKYWSEIVSENYLFDRDAVETERVKQITKDQIVQCYQTFLEPGAKQRRKLSVHVQSKDHRGPHIPESADQPDGVLENHTKKASLVDNHIDFKRGMQLFPLPKPAVEFKKHTPTKL